jgi:hypothetical protein
MARPAGKDLHCFDESGFTALNQGLFPILR